MTQTLKNVAVRDRDRGVRHVHLEDGYGILGALGRLGVAGPQAHIRIAESTKYVTGARAGLTAWVDGVANVLPTSVILSQP
ncbi:hypothetical protein IID24_04110 [Patescibacteria group bacterium]|nr:hypothetical protein [Patescibacteria group bacterium]